MNGFALTALSPLDGRYADKVAPLKANFSELGLFKARLIVEVEWLKALAAEDQIKEVKPLSADAIKTLDALVANFDEAAGQKIKDFEKTTRHDVKAIEYYLKDAIKNHAELNSVSEFIHFACTSEDINNVSYALMIKEGRETLLQIIQKIEAHLLQLAHDHARQAMLSRTHGQSASPTTVGKEFANVMARVQIAKENLMSAPIKGKINGAVGCFNAHAIAYPNVDWMQLSQRFIENLGLTHNPLTTQIEPHDWMAQLLDALARLNTILIDLSRDVWGYIAWDYFKQKLVEGEVGSSTMPHKVNPIDFENAEGNFGICNALARHLSEKLPISRWQRDLSDSTVQRNFGVVFGHALLGYQSLLVGLGKLEINKTAIDKDLDAHWEVLAEAIQTVMRRYGIEAPYEKLKALTRGQTLNAEIFEAFIMEQDLPADVKQTLSALTPATYVGLAQDLVKREC